MLPLSEELRQARAELETWARLRTTGSDALLTVQKAQRFIERAERAEAACPPACNCPPGTHSSKGEP